MSRIRELGITAYAAKAFLSILENQPVSATSLCNLTGIPDSKIYYALKELEEKSLIMVQHGTPSQYRAMGTDQIASNLQSQIDADHQRRSKKVKELAKLLEPIRTSGGGEDAELAYIIKSSRNIVEKMKETIEASRKEVVVMFDNETLLAGIAESLKRARKRGSSIKLALAGGAFRGAPKLEITPSKTLCCASNILIVDSEKLFTVSGDAPANFRAVVTQDESMIYMSRQSYENPACCSTSKAVDIEVRSTL